MLILKTIFILTLIHFSLNLDPLIKDLNNYGPYILAMNDFECCKGTKSKNLTAVTTTFDEKLLIATVNMTFFLDVKINEIKVSVHKVKDNNKKTLMWNHKMSDPCKIYPIDAQIKQFLKAEHCLVKKGNYFYTLNYGDLVQLFLGDTYFYGTYLYRSEMYSKNGNVGCFSHITSYIKKT